MQLKKVYFDAYKSLLDAELEIADSCIGLVGINESGKSNILKALAALSPDNPLTIADTPKMVKRNPALRFQFTLDDEEQREIAVGVDEWIGKDKLPESLLTNRYTLVYHVNYDRDALEEKRYFTIGDTSLPAGTLVLKSDAITNRWRFRRGDNYAPLDKAILITAEELQSNLELIEKSATLSAVLEKFENVQIQVATALKARKEKPDSDTLSEPNDTQDVASVRNENLPSQELLSDAEFQRLQSELIVLKDQKELLKEELGEFDLEQVVFDVEAELEETISAIMQMRTEVQTATAKSDAFLKSEVVTDAQKEEINTVKKNLQLLKTKLQKAEQLKNELDEALLALRQPLNDKYTDKAEDLSRRIGDLACSIVEHRLPQVVFWQHRDEFILKGQTEFESIIMAEKLSDISRPLVNLFRIALDIQTMDALRTVVAEIQNDAGERRTYEAKLDRKINEYIQSVWQDYDQRIKVSLEQERILVQFYDPKCDYASFFEMQERSQGCQTFISFLLTIGAEAKQGVIRDTVLLLDEPETHLHPSGVRFMLQELIKAAMNGNKVVFATHSIFMIDRECYNRHAIVSKKAQQTTIQPSCKDRIGFFMQEEVLYSTLDIDLNKDFDSTNRYNFVFEGDGDATIFHHFYSFLEKQKQPFNLEFTSFYQGGKCTSIKKYFANRPIQLGSVWVFILDKDKASDDLREFLEGKYKEFLNKDVFVFQYARENLTKKEIELEDLLPESILQEVIAEASASILPEENPSLANMVDNGVSFAEYFKQITAKIDADKRLRFKEITKTLLNAKIAEKVGNIKNMPVFDETFSAYTIWARATVETIGSYQGFKEKKDASI